MALTRGPSTCTRPTVLCMPATSAYRTIVLAIFCLREMERNSKGGETKGEKECKFTVQRYEHSHASLGNKAKEEKMRFVDLITIHSSIIVIKITKRKCGRSTRCA